MSQTIQGRGYFIVISTGSPLCECAGMAVVLVEGENDFPQIVTPENFFEVPSYS